MSNPETYPKDAYISWEQIHEDAKALAQKLNGLAEWKGIVAITRGGMVPAGLVAQENNIKMIETLCIVSYDYQDQGEAVVLKQPELPHGGKGWLIIDDLVDTGGTFRLAREMYPQAVFATLYAKPKGTKTVDHFITEFSQETWIHFPWEPE